MPIFNVVFIRNIVYSVNVEAPSYTAAEAWQINASWDRVGLIAGEPENTDTEGGNIEELPETLGKSRIKHTVKVRVDETGEEIGR